MPTRSRRRVSSCSRGPPRWSRPARESGFLEVERLDAALGAADVIVSHGGPATIAAAWARGLLPIVVPRVPKLGEHVDDHQVSFAVRLAELGRVRLAQTPAEFTGALAEATSNHARFRPSVPGGPTSTRPSRASAN